MPQADNALQAMTDLADFVAMHTRDKARPLLAEAAKEQSKLLQLLLWQAAGLMERAFWSLCKSLQPAANTPGRSSASKASVWRTICILSASMALRWALSWQLAEMYPGISPAALLVITLMDGQECYNSAQQSYVLSAKADSVHLHT